MKRLHKGWEVEWCSHVPVNERGDSDLHAATNEIREFADHDKAVAFARTVLDKDYFGSVRVRPFELRPFEPGYPGLTKEFTGDSEVR